MSKRIVVSCLAGIFAGAMVVAMHFLPVWAWLSPLVALFCFFGAYSCFQPDGTP